MLQIRLNAFETNSSSSHAFCIKKDLNIEPLAEKKTIVAKLGYYDWDTAEYEAGEFLSYVWTAAVGKLISDMYLLHRIEKILKPYNIQVVWQFEVFQSESELNRLFDSCDSVLSRVLDDLLDVPELFVAMVLGDSSVFYQQPYSGDIEESYKDRNKYQWFETEQY
jgi:hypothetical protein